MPHIKYLYIIMYKICYENKEAFAQWRFGSFALSGATRTSSFLPKTMVNI